MHKQAKRGSQGLPIPIALSLSLSLAFTRAFSLMLARILFYPLLLVLAATPEFHLYARECGIESVCVCVRACVRESVCVCVRERESVCVYERERGQKK